MILNLLQPVCGKLRDFVEAEGFRRHILTYSPAELLLLIYITVYVTFRVAALWSDISLSYSQHRVFTERSIINENKCMSLRILTEFLET